MLWRRRRKFKSAQSGFDGPIGDALDFVSQVQAIQRMTAGHATMDKILMNALNGHAKRGKILMNTSIFSFKDIVPSASHDCFAV